MQSITEAVEAERVARHIDRAMTLASHRDVSALGHLQRVLRQLLLRELARYPEARRFPRNRDFAILTPYFIDADGTRCAMAHLLELGGEKELVARIARERNNAYVRELADESRLLAWLQAAGFTVEEAAAIQPAYCSLTTDCICGGDFSYVDYPVPARGVLEGTVLENGTARVERIYGESLGVTVGSAVPLQYAPASGTHVMIPIDAPVSEPLSFVAFDNDVYECSSQGVSSAPPLNVGEFAAAVLANDCAGALHEVSPAWSREPDCEGDGPLPDNGCSAGGAETSVGVLLALVAAIARRGRQPSVK